MKEIIRVCFDTCIIIDIKKIGEEGAGDDTAWSEWLQTQEGKRKFDDLRALQYLLAMPDQWEIEYLPSDIVYAELKNTEFYLEFLEWAGQKISSKKIRLKGIQQTLDGKPLFSKKTKKGKTVPIITKREDVEQLFWFYLNNRCDIFVSTDYKHITSNAKDLEDYGIRVMSPHQLLSLLVGDKRPVELLERLLYGVGFVDHPKFHST